MTQFEASDSQLETAFLANTPLFHGIHPDEVAAMMGCLAARQRTYKRGETILRAGDTIHELGLIQQGSANIVVNHYWGGSTIFGHIERGDIFAENYAAIPGRELICDVVAAEDTCVLFLDMRNLLTTCGHACGFHNRLVQNLLRISASKNLGLSTRMMHTAPKSIRERLLSYLSEQAQQHGSPRFIIPFSRQELADYLSVDRSALSNELSKMRREGLIAFRKSEFELSPTMPGARRQ